MRAQAAEISAFLTGLLVGVLVGILIALAVIGVGLITADRLW